MNNDGISHDDDRKNELSKLVPPSSETPYEVSCRPVNTPPSPLEGLAFNFRKNTQSDAADSKNHGEKNSPSGKNKIAEAIKTVASSPTPYSSASNVLFAVGVSYAGIVGHVVSGIWSLRNEVIAKFRSKNGQAEQTNQNSDSSPSYTKLIEHLLHSPGASRIFQTGVLLASMLEAPFHGRFSAAAAFSVWFVGVAAAAFEMNKGYGGAEFSELGAVKGFKNLWSKLPDSSHRILTSPGISFCLGDLIYSLSNMDLTAMFSNFSASPVNVAAGLGLLASLTGIAVGVASAFSKHEGKHEKSLPLYCAGLDCGLYGVAQLLSQNTIIGIGFGLGFLSNVAFGLRAWMTRGKKEE